MGNQRQRAFGLIKTSRTTLIWILIIAVAMALVISVSIRTQKSLDNAVPLSPDLTEHIALKNDQIIIHKPKPLSVIASPFKVDGEARGPWYFEANFGLTLTDWDGRIIAESFASAVIDPQDPESTWMTEEFVPFEGMIEFENPAFPETDDTHFSRRGTLIFQKANPSGLPENADALEIPVLFASK